MIQPFADSARTHENTQLRRWRVGCGARVLGLPKSTKPSRIKESISASDFELSPARTAIDGLGTGRRGGPQPTAATGVQPADLEA
jgi:diketogulonate reductase-like aldo/keto reductase